YFEATVMQIVSLEDVVGDTEHEDLDPLVVLESVRSPDPDPHTTTIVNEQRRILHQCVQWLPKPEQSVIKMYYYQNMTLKQIAKEINRSESRAHQLHAQDRKSTRLNSSHVAISYAVFCLKKKNA